jgi:SAM-dependent methyltransferase
MTPSCLICSSASEIWRRKDGFDIFQCRNNLCGHGFVYPLPSEDELRRFYDKSDDARENNSGWTLAADFLEKPVNVEKFYERSRIRLLRKHGLLHSKQNRIVDLGCSTGAFLAVLKMRGYQELLGCEISESQANHCTNVFGISTTSSLSEVDSESRDLITAYAILEHSEDPRVVLQEAWRVLSPHGSIVIDVPNTRSFYQSLTRQSWPWLIPPAHLQYFTPASLRELLVQCGFRVRKEHTLSTSTYTYLLVWHVYRALHRSMPTTSLVSGRARRLLVQSIETAIRTVLFPLSLLARVTRRHNRLIYIAEKPEDA